MFEFIRWFVTLILFPTVALAILIIQAFENLKARINGGQVVTVVHVIERPLHYYYYYHLPLAPPAHHASSPPSTTLHSPTPMTPSPPSPTPTTPSSPSTTPAPAPPPSVVLSEGSDDDDDGYKYNIVWEWGIFIICVLVLSVVYVLIGILIPKFIRPLWWVLGGLSEIVIGFLLKNFRIPRHWRRAHQEILETAMDMV